MMSTAIATESATTRPLRLRMRGDLELRPQRFGGQRYWAVKDPVALRYFHIGEEEYALLNLLDGQTSLEELRRRCNQAMAPQRLSVEQIHGYLATLHRFGLVQADAPDQGTQLHERMGEQKRRRRLESLASVLAIRFPGVNPRSVLNVLDPLLGWIFSPVCVVLVCLLGLAAAGLVLINFATFEARLPELDAILAASNLPWLAISLATIKILHELGHALACRRFGSDCHEIGVMLLVFTPCLYCNVSDSWMLSSKWQRIAIAAAGVYVELILASVCTFLWWFSQPGLFHSLCLNTVLICSLGTLLLNGNPLLRYDGYFILSDLVEVPNLRAQANAALKRLHSRHCLGLEPPAERLAPKGMKPLLVAYAVAAGVYRLVLVVLVLWMLDAILRPLHLEVLVVLVGCLAIVGMLWPLANAVVRRLGDPTRRRRASMPRVALVAVILLASSALLVFLPLPMRVSAPLVLEYRDAQRVYVTVVGTMLSGASVGQHVEAGETIARLEDAETQLDLARLTAERDRQQAFVKNLEVRHLHGGGDGTEIPAAKATLDDLNRRLEQVAKDAQRLTIVSPIAGTVLTSPNVPLQATEPHSLPLWTGTPLDQRNRGATLETGTLVCLVGDPHSFEAILHVDEEDVELVQAGQAVQIMFDHLPGESFGGTIAEVARQDLEVMPRELAALGELPARTDKQGVAHPLATWYQARVQLAEAPPHLLGRMPGRAKIDVARRTLAERLIRYLKQTFAKRS